MKFSRFTKAALACATALWITLPSVSAAAEAADYPTRPLRLIVPFGPGSVTDLLARIVATELGKSLNQSIVVENKSGADGNIGATYVAAAEHDGYTLMLGPASTNAINVSLHKNLRYDPLRDFAPITHVASVTNVVVVSPTVAAKSMPELVDLLKTKHYSYASTGAGGSMHLAVELFKVATGVQAQHVPYRSGAALLPDLLSGRVEFMFCNLPLCLPQVKSGDLRALAVTSARRSSLLPDVPTVAEAGVPGYAVEGWYGLFAPAGVPTAILDRLNTETVKILKDPKVRELMLAQGAEPVGNSRAEFTQFVKQEHDRWAKVIQEAGIKLD